MVVVVGREGEGAKGAPKGFRRVGSKGSGPIPLGSGFGNGGFGVQVRMCVFGSVGFRLFG